jgi:hypothetical protein
LSQPSVQRFFGRALAIDGFSMMTSRPETSFLVTFLPAPVQTRGSKMTPRVRPSKFLVHSTAQGEITIDRNTIMNQGGVNAVGLIVAPWRSGGIESPAQYFVANSTVVDTVEGQAYQLDEPYQVALQDAGFTYSGTAEGYAVFHNSASGTLSASNGAVITHHETKIWGDEWATVSVPVGGATLTRSSAWLPGWLATAVNTQTGKSVSLFVKRSDLVQSVRIPAGTWRLHFHYHAPFIGLGVLSSALGTLALFVSAAVLRRHRKNTLAE